MKAGLGFVIYLSALIAAGCSAAQQSATPVADSSAKRTLGATQKVGSNTFTLTGSMNTARARHISTLLASGEVLVTGGVDVTSGTAFAGSELYNPTKGKWSVTGSMSVARVFHTATLLSNGKVLVAGGAPALNGNCVATAELFNPSTGQWSATGSMTTARCGHSAALLADGEVLVAGGDIDPGFNSLVSAELFNPASGTWHAVGNLNQAREDQLSARLQNGKVLVVGGRDFVNSTFTNLASAELFDPSLGTWSKTGSLSRADGLPFGTPLANGDVLAASVGFFNPGNGTWTNAGTFPQLGLGATATLLGDGNVLLTGFTAPCDECGFNPSNVAVLYEASTNSYTNTGGMNASRIYDSAALLPNGQVLVSGGENRVFQTNSSAELYSP